MWESLLIAVIPATLATIITHVINRRKHKVELEKMKVEVERMQQEVKNSQSINMQTILETYNATLAQYKLELEDVNKRFSNYIKEANKRAQANKDKIESLERSNKELKRRMDILLENACTVKDCSMRELLKEE